MDISSCAEHLLAQNTFMTSLSNKTRHILRHGSDQEYIDALANLALDSRYTFLIFTTHRSIITEICSKWLAALRAELPIDGITVILAFTRILPLAPHLTVYANELLFSQRLGNLQVLSSRSAMALIELPESYLSSLLLSLFRLLRFNNKEYADLISPVQLQILLGHQQHYIRYLAVRILCLFLHASDAAMEKMIHNYCSKEPILGSWEHIIIDYAFLTLWEEKKIEDFTCELEDGRRVDGKIDVSSTFQRIISQEDLSASTVCLGKVLVPSLNTRSSRTSPLIMTKTFIENISRVAHAINDEKPVLIRGHSGCGKTSIIKKVADELGQGTAMITFYLNDQTDARQLIGMYVNANTPGSFRWQPGVLTRAVMEGRWVLIEDLDRAPTEILSTLLPLLERRELLVPHWGEAIQAASGFKMIATIRTNSNLLGAEQNPGFNMVGMRHWAMVPLLMPDHEELAEVVECRYPILHAYVPKIIRVYSNIVDITKHMRAKLISQRQIGPRNLYRWCSRLKDLLSTAGVRSGTEPIPEILNDMVLLEAIDCFAGHLPDGATKAHVVEVISQELHVPLERMKYCMEVRKPEFTIGDAILRIGRTCKLKKTNLNPVKSIRDPKRIPFAFTSNVLRHLESITIAVKMAEPCLLVGETGTGKTTLIQQLADILGFKLRVINLSQQSEASDLLGGFKPVNNQVLAIQIKEEFDLLFESTFSSKRNQKYIDSIAKAISKSRWLGALKLWKEALDMVKRNFELRDPTIATGENFTVEPRTKKRKLETPKNLKLQRRWDEFASRLQMFQMHISGDSNGVAFSFVEGHIVKAAKNGDWILLDEINLASQDTLESLAGLISNDIDDVPTLILPDTGNTEPIQAHKDFRIFGAMNPATDIGKRDLPTSLRSRFTEIYLDHPDQDLENLSLIIRVYLGNCNNLDLHIATDIAHLYLEVQKLAAKNVLVDGASQKPHFSLRTLTRTLIYVTDILSLYGLRRALYEGFSMSFLTLLNKESELIVQPLIQKYILGSSKNALSRVQQMPRAPQDAGKYVQFRHYWISRGNDPISRQSHYVITPFVERNLLNLVRATSTRRFPVLLQGPTSSGKTSMVEYLARISGHICVRINNHEHTDLQEYLGSYTSGTDGGFQYREGVLVRALREGHWIILDELNLAPTDVLEALNRLLDDNKELFVPETQQVIKPHENFMLFATQNPPGIYGGRKVLSRALRNRFLELHFDNIPEDELETILRERSQIAPSFCAKIVAVYKRLSIVRQRDRLFDQKNSFATLRDLFRWAFRDAENREKLALDGFMLLAERVRNPNERLVVKEIIEDIMKVKIDVARSYEINSSSLFSKSNFPLSPEIVWTKSMRRLYVLVCQALRRNEPVLLVGETGSGKTTICQVIAAAMDKKLHILNAHQNMETGDLIGAQRPVRNRATASNTLMQDLTQILKNKVSDDQILTNDLPSLLSAYDALIQKNPQSFSTQERVRIEQNRTRLESLFEWCDSSLVHAMRNGQYFLLDEISLADDSVLERINSVLESDRALLLAEQGSTDNLVTASDGFQFLATMNPGGDYGKRELSPALRNRFTEIWVSDIVGQEEMFQIADAKLSASFFRFSSPMVDFAEWYTHIYNPVTPNVCIRELLAWIQFVNSYVGSDLYYALLHGAAMVYIDGLGANPTSGLRISEADVQHHRQECLDRLSILFQHDMTSIYEHEVEFSFTDHRLDFGSFRLETVSQTSRDSQYCMEAPNTKANTMKIIRALQLQKPILLEGNPGVGKSTIVIALADLAGIPLTRINLSDQTELIDLFGSDVPIDGAHVGHFGWRDAPFLRAMQKGEWVLLDEMNLASQTVLEGLNACFDHRGQVYISELDQSFTRHPRFTVFAAQNPYHQGGGRKGLPASFVNRFTTIYFDAFKASDLLMICSQCFPQDSVQFIESLVCSVTDISDALHTSKGIGNHGGPWEINLRDLLRWLNLLHSDDLIASAGNPVDYQDLVLLQRFRHSENITTVTKVLEKYLLQAKRTPSLVYNMTSSYLQVGFAFIHRDSLFTPTIDRRMQQISVNLRLVESALFCVKNNWPCLLVGSSGSGKTTLISQLASFLGADLVNLPLNANMDTMDLIGGYEQLDVQRHRKGLFKRLRHTTRIMIADHLVSAIETDSNILALEEKLRGDMPDLKEIMNLIQRLANIYPNSGYSDFASEFGKLFHQPSTGRDNRFEWVDGLLVEALKQGHWLNLENANLCSSSILDRLNALLEPNGVLSINENCAPDGSAQIVKPHPNFRIFLTVDPRHGELSRAMRNRCIEIYMSIDHSHPIKPLGTIFEPSVSHFHVLDMIDWTIFDNSLVHQLSSLCADYLTFADYQICRRWQRELAKGLLTISPTAQALLISEISIRHDILRARKSTIIKIQATYEELALRYRVLSGFAEKQSFNPLQNPVLNAVNVRCGGSFDLVTLGESLELLVEIARLDARLQLLSQQLVSKSPLQMTRLELSLGARKSEIFEHVDTRHVGDFLRHMTKILEDIIDQDSHEDRSASQSLVRSVKRTTCYLHDIFDLTNSSEFEESVFQSYLSIGKHMLECLSHCEETKSLAEKLGSELNEFSLAWQLSTGLSMETLWGLFRPPTAKNLEQLDFRVKVGQLANRFDAIKWMAGASIRDLNLLRAIITTLHNAVDPTGFENNESIREIETAITELEKNHSILTESTVKPYFSEAFEGLCQHRALENFGASPPSLDLLAGRSASSPVNSGDISEPWILLAHIEKFTGIFNSENSLVTLRNTLHVSLIGKMSNIHEVSLESLSLLWEEMKIISSNVMTFTTYKCDHVRAFNILLARILEKVCRAHKVFLDPLSLSSCLFFLEKYCKISATDPIISNYPVLRLSSRVSGSLYFAKEIINYLNPALKALHESLEEKPPKLATASMAWILVFTCCLRLYVPDKTFDPALKLFVERNRYHKRQEELQAKLKSVQAFEVKVSGQSTSLRSEMLQHALQTLGDEPEVIAVPRPRVSELKKLCGEFKNLLTSVVFRCPNGPALLSSNDDYTRQQEFELLRSNISRIIPRICTGFAAYEDITKPLVAMLQGLDVGLSMALISNPANIWSGSDIRYISASTPFLGMRRTYFSEANLNDRKFPSDKDLDSRIRFLNNMALYRSIDQEQTRAASQKLCEVFHNIYQVWKERLELDKRYSASVTSMYRYRGSETDTEKNDDIEFQAVFPEFTDGHEKSETLDKSQNDQRKLAQELAGCHEDIFKRGKSTVHIILNTLQVSAEKMGKLWLQEPVARLSDVPPEEIGCAIILSLSNHQSRLDTLAITLEKYNFYVDSNLAEVKTLITIIRKIQVRFLFLTNAWPEHAVIKHVLQISSELMRYKHTEPIAKIITKTEQLHASMHEWESVASKEYSAIDLYHQITNVLISWRRLELSTWAQLLNMEDKKSDDDVEAWWFVAYEVIIAVPLSMINAGESLQTYSQHLFANLAEFLATASIGQYSRRLRLIECFKIHIDLLSIEDHSLGIIYDTLTNFLCFYTPSEEPIREALSEGRIKLEKDMREVILLASWKDTNINALRESAKRSHHKLFKIIRKYRTLLAQPAKDFIGGRMSEDPAKSETVVENMPPHALSQDLRAVEISKQYVSDWGFKPARFTDTISTVTRIKSLSQLKPNVLDRVLSLKEYTEDLIRDIETLQKETSSKAIKENIGSVKQLKTRKKKRYAEALRYVRNMGFQSNLSSQMLKQQASWATILGKLPSMPPMTSSFHFQDADFYKLLRKMPGIRESAHNHSSDLNAREVSRSIGHLESILFLIIKQRNQFISRLQDLNCLDEAIRLIWNVWAPSKYTLQQLDPRHENAAKSLKKIVRCLPGIIETGCILMRKYSELSGYDSSIVFEMFGNWQKEMESLNQAYDSLPIIPPNTSTSMHEKMHHRAEKMISGFKVDLETTLRDHIPLTFILKQIESWIELDETRSPTRINDEPMISLKEYDGIISEACDTILVATQQTQHIISLFSTFEGDLNWVQLMDAFFVECLGAFHTRKITTILRAGITKLFSVALSDEGGLAAAAALWTTVLPIIQQFRNSLKEVIQHYAHFLQALCKLALVLGDAFCHIASEGFCSPAEDDPTATENLEKLEKGTGLGEGEGKNDISKDIQDDEDLTELAQKELEGVGDNIDDQEDAVNMDHDEMEGESEDAAEDDEGDIDVHEEEDDLDIDDEAGDVDDLDPSAVDEKLWDSSAKETKKERRDPEKTGATQENESVAAETDATKTSKNDDYNKDDEMSENNGEENEQLEGEEGGTIDPHVQEEPYLDLPEELDFNDEDNSSIMSGSDFGSAQGGSTTESESLEEPKPESDNKSSEEAAIREEVIQPLEEQVGTLNVHEQEQDGSSIDSESDKASDLEQDFPSAPTMNPSPDFNNGPVTEAADYSGEKYQADEIEGNQDQSARAKEEGRGDMMDQDDGAAPGSAQIGRNSENSQGIVGQEERSEERLHEPAFRKLGDALERWYNRQRDIQDSAKEQKAAQNDLKDADMAGQDFEHLNDDQAFGDTQALGAATHDQAHALDKNAMDFEMQDHPIDFLPDKLEVEEPVGDNQQIAEDIESHVLTSKDSKDLSRSGAAIMENPAFDNTSKKDLTMPSANLETEIDDPGADLSITHLQSTSHLTLRTPLEASQLWAHFELLTHSLSLSLTEQLRLILAPTLATRMRGDFRTGKRLNIKRIIPYIASNYKRDKIWMRRSMPSKRTYQILLAVDDSKSMSENQGGQLALETLALVAKSLSMLEVGELCILSFGGDVRVAHPFNRPFSADAGPTTFRHFSFQQHHTNVKKLLQASLILLQEARLTSTKMGATDLWQLQLIISDGICEDHEIIRQLVRNAQDQRIVIVFVIVDSGKNESILDMNQAVFEPDFSEEEAQTLPGITSASGIGGAVATRLKIKRYLDSFPFPYYLVVSDVKELPGVLAAALKQWFAEVVESE